MPVMADVLVTFRHKESGEEIGPVLVSFTPATPDMLIQSHELKNPFACTWDEPLLFPLASLALGADRHVRMGDTVVCARLSAGSAPVHQPMTWYTPTYCSRAIVDDVQA